MEQTSSAALREDGDAVPSPSQFLGIAFVTCAMLVASLGCSGTPLQHADAGRMLPSGSQAAKVGGEEVEVMQARLSRLKVLAQEALDAAMLIGTTDHELSTARRAFAMAEQTWREGHHAYEAGHYQASWEQLQLAEAAFMQAEEQAVRAGLHHIDAELTQAYVHGPAVEAQRSRLRGESVRVVEELINLRAGAGIDYRITGRARMGEVLQIIAEEEGWYRVRTEQGTVGWVSKVLVEPMD